MINNYNLELFLMNHFKKNIKDISKDEFDKLEEISLDGIDISGIYEIIDFKHVLDIFPNIKSLVINNYVYLIEINRNYIIEYSFYKCDLINVSKYNILNHTKNLLFERCIFNDYDFLNSGFDNLEILCISNPADEEEQLIYLYVDEDGNEIEQEKASFLIIKKYVKDELISEDKFPLANQNNNVKL